MSIFGLFECRCGNIWTCTNAERRVSQECSNCRRYVRPRKAMFGRFECDCGRVWHSKRAVEGYMQECDDCGEYVEPLDLKEVKMFGLFKCPECYHEWASASAWVGYTQGCTECDEDTLPYQLNYLRRKKGDWQQLKDKSHISSLCGKCREQGYNCAILNWCTTKKRPKENLIVSRQ